MMFRIVDIVVGVDYLLRQQMMNYFMCLEIVCFRIRGGLFVGMVG